MESWCIIFVGNQLFLQTKLTVKTVSEPIIFPRYTEPSVRRPPYYQILQVGVGLRRKLRSTFFRSERSKAYSERAGKGNWVGDWTNWVGDWTKVRSARQSARRSRIEGWKSIHTSGCKHLSRIHFCNQAL